MLTNPLDVASVDVGIETATGAGGSQPIEVRLYSIANADQLSLANLTQVGSAIFNFADAGATVANFPVTGTVDPVTDDLVVEVFTPDGQTAGNQFFIGSNNAGQSAPSYLAAADCGVAEPTDIASLGFPDMHIVMVVNGADIAGISIDDIDQAEGDTGTTDFTFTVTRTLTENISTVEWTVVDGIAKNGSAPSPVFDNDFDLPAPFGGTLNFAVGVDEQTITIPVNGDTRYETDEDFKILLSSPVNAVVTKGTGIGTIQNDDTLIACGVPSNPLLNCSFEEPGPGDFTDWLPNDMATPLIPLQVAAEGLGVLFPTYPTDGIFSVLNGFDGTGPDIIQLAQDVSIPLAATTLEFDYRLGWEFLVDPFVDRTFSVHIEPVGGGTPIQTLPVLSTSAVVNMPDTGILRAELDISAFAGQTVRINFVWNVPEDTTGLGQAELDNILIRVTPGVHVTPTSGLETTEGLGSDTFDIILNTSPSSPVTLSFVSDVSTEGTAAPVTATFDASNWDAPQTITVIGVNDDVMDGDQLYKVVNTITTASPEYPADMPVDDVSVTNLDNNAQLTIKKIATGGNATFEFSSSSTPMLDSASITTVGGIGQQEFFTALEEGAHDLTEDALGGWSQEAASCDNGKSLPDIQLDAGENVTCTFENTKLGSLTVVKNTIGDNGTFNFTSASSIGNFTITTASNTGQQAFTDLTPGTYDVAETVPAGWSMTNSVCSDGSILPNVEVDAGENVTCTFENTKLGSLTVIKNTIGGDGTFSFTSASSIGNFNITTTSNTGQQAFTDLTPGTYDVAETVPAGWSMTNSVCSDGSILPNVEVDAGENVTCTFENTKLGSLTVIKNTIGGDGTFSFTSASSIGNFNITTTSNTGQQAFTDLTPGTYDVAETVPAGWSMTNSVCSDGSTLPNVEVDAGENVTCTFENTQHAPALTLTKSAAPASFALLGDSIRYLFEAKNEGNVDLTAVTVTDPLSGLGTIDCDGSGGPTVATLAVAGSFSCEAMYAITQADLDAGSVTNKAMVVAKDPSLNDVTADSNEVIISKLTDVCYEGELTIPDGMVFMGSGSTTYSSTVSIDTAKPATPMGVIVEAPHELILKAPTVEFNKMFDVEGDADVDNPPGGGQLRVIIGPVTCP